ncbi:unnamed protein product [Knipowitschia caucasica]
MPPKTSASSKSRTMEGYVGNATASGANAGGANANAGRQNEPAQTPNANPGEDKTYAVCREMCKEMSMSILGKIDERFDAFDTRFETLLSEQANLRERLDSQEQATCSLDLRVTTLENKYEALTKHASQLQNKLLDLEARSRRHNIKIVGIEEGTERGNPTDFVSRLIPELVGKEHFPRPVKVDRAHRTAQQAQPGKSRTILARIHHFQEKELILQRSRIQQGFEYNGKKVLIFPDYTSEVMTQRRAFRDVMQTLRDHKIKHTLRYPARLHVYWRNGEAPAIFNDAKEAAWSLEQHKSSEKE